MNLSVANFSKLSENSAQKEQVAINDQKSSALLPCSEFLLILGTAATTTSDTTTSTFPDTTAESISKKSIMRELQSRNVVAS